jgi:hypothetical protein
MVTACLLVGTGLLAKVARRVDDGDVLHLLKIMLKANGNSPFARSFVCECHSISTVLHLARAVFGAILGTGPPWLLPAKAAAAADMCGVSDRPEAVAAAKAAPHKGHSALVTSPSCHAATRLRGSTFWMPSLLQ